MSIVKTRAEIIQDLVDAIKSRDAAIETGFGPVKDIVIDPVSLVARELYTQVGRVFDLLFLSNASIMTQEELDLWGESFGISRKMGTHATGSVFFTTSSKPTADITIPAGTPVSTTQIAGSVTFQTFVTTRTLTILASSADTFFNPTSGFFEFEVPIRALLPGVEGNVAPGTIRTLQRQIPGVAGVINKSATVGGRNIETNEEFARRIRLLLLGMDRGTAGGVRRFALDDARVVDAAVVQAGEPLLKRTEFVAGAVDVYILGQELKIDQQPSTYTGLDIYFRKEPIVFPNPVIRVFDSFVTYTEGIHFFIDRDVILEGSTKARNAIRWNRGATGLPTPGTSLIIEYTYDNLILELQSVLEKPESNILTDVLFRRSSPVDVVLDCTVTVFADVDVAQVLANIRTAVRDFVNNRGLGEDIVPSDIDVVIRSVSGVDFVHLPFNRLSRTTEQGNSGISIEKNEYAQITDGNITINIAS